MPGRRRSRSRSGRRRNRQPSRSTSSSPVSDRRTSRGKAAKEPPKSSKEPPKAAKEPPKAEKPPAKAAKKAPPPAAAASESEEEEDEAEEAAAEEEEEPSLEAKVALLEVENETLKAENRELRKRLVELLRTRGPGAAERQAAPAAEERRRRAEPAPEAGERRAERRQEEPPRRGSRQEEEPPRRGSRQEEEPPRRRREPSPEQPQEEEPQGPNAVMLSNSQMEVYCESITNNVPLEKRLPLVKAKLERFLGHFDEKIHIVELKSGSMIIKDRKMFTARYTCVFRESGAKLKGTCNKRFFYDGSGVYKATYVLDYELHESLVTAVQGTPQDGNLGVRDPRTEHLVVLYEEKGGKITRMWLRPDTEKVGMDPYAGEEIIERNETFKAFEAKIAELKGGSTGPRVFHNYHQVPTLG